MDKLRIELDPKRDLALLLRGLAVIKHLDKSQEFDIANLTIKLENAAAEFYELKRKKSLES